MPNADPGDQPRPAHVEDTSESDVADAAANAAADALIDAAEADPIVPGEPQSAHYGDGGAE